MANDDIFLRNLGGRVGVPDWLMTAPYGAQSGEFEAPPDTDPYGSAAVAAAVRRRAPVREPDPLALAASSGGAVPWGAFLPSDERARTESYQAFLGNDFNPRDTFLSAFGNVGAPALGPAEATAATLGAGIVRRGAKALEALPKQTTVVDRRVAVPYDEMFGMTPAERAAARPDAPYPQYAEQYPAVGPPNIVTYKDTGKVGPSKQLTPEAETFAKDRNKIQKQMNEEGYARYYDPEKRFYVDPANYPPANVNTLTANVPQRPDALTKYLDVIGAPETAKALQAAYTKGKTLGPSDHWYAMGQLEADYIKELGPEAGRKAFLDEYAVPLAAVTSGQEPKANFLMSQYLEYLRKNNMPLPKGYETPVTIGGEYLGTNLRNYQAMRDKGGYPALGKGQPKQHNFTRSQIGDISQAVMDDQMASGMLKHLMDQLGPNPTKAQIKEVKALIDNARGAVAFGLLEAPVHKLAKRLGVEPGNVQDIAWAGFRNQQGQPMIDVVNEAIERTHRLTGMPREEIVRRGIIRKEIPVYTPGPVLLPDLGGNVPQEDMRAPLRITVNPQR